MSSEGNYVGKKGFIFGSQFEDIVHLQEVMSRNARQLVTLHLQSGIREMNTGF